MDLSKLKTIERIPGHPDEWDKFCEHTNCPGCDGPIKVGELACGGVCDNCYWEGVKESQNDV